MQNQINLTPITQFVQLLRAAELGQQKEIKVTIQQNYKINYYKIMKHYTILLKIVKIQK